MARFRGEAILWLVSCQSCVCDVGTLRRLQVAFVPSLCVRALCVKLGVFPCVSGKRAMPGSVHIL